VETFKGGRTVADSVSFGLLSSVTCDEVREKIDQRIRNNRSRIWNEYQLWGERLRPQQKVFYSNGVRKLVCPLVQLLCDGWSEW